VVCGAGVAGHDWGSRMHFHAARHGGAAARWAVWGRVERASGWAPPNRGDLSGHDLPPRPPLQNVDSRRGADWAEVRGGLRRGERVADAAGAGAFSGGSAADGLRCGESGGADGRGKAVQDSREATKAPAGAGAAGGNSAGGAQGVPGLVVAREGPRGGGDVGTKRQPAAPPAHYPPPKRTAVSARRQFSQCCGREAAAPLGRADGGSRFRAARADYSSDTLDKAAPPPPRPPRAGSNDGVRPGAESLSSACAKPFCAHYFPVYSVEVELHVRSKRCANFC
jgi:hypothetical protein